MTKRQAELINIMCIHTGINSYYVTAYKELLGSCSDALVQPTVTVSTTGTATPPPPSTPTPLGPEWWKERQAEALREQIQIIADQNKKIEELQKQIEEDKEHWQKKSAIDTGYRNHANELVLANKEIIESLRHWGLRNSGSLVSNVVDVIKLCAERGKEIEEFRKVVRDRNDEIEKLKGRIEVLDRMAKARKQFDEHDRVLMEKKDKEIESLKHRIEVAQGFTQQDREIIAKRNTEIADLRKQVSTLSKQISQRDMTIAVLNKQIDQTNKLCDEETQETERLKEELEVAGKKRKVIVEAGNRLRDTLREIRSYNKLLMGEELLSDQAIQLWEDNTTP